MREKKVLFNNQICAFWIRGFKVKRKLIIKTKFNYSLQQSKFLQRLAVFKSP